MRRVLSRGITLVELMVSLGILAVMLAAGLPYYADYAINSRLREGGNALFTEAIAAQSEAIRRNLPINLAVAGSSLSVVNPADNTVLRSRDLGRDLLADDSTVTFGSTGAVVGGNAAEIGLRITSKTCTDDIRCPKLRVEAGGGLKLCGNKLGALC